MKRKAVIFLAIITSLIFTPASVRAQDSHVAGVEALSQAFRSAVGKVLPAVVYLEVLTSAEQGYYGRYYSGSGSGVIIDAENGYVLTASHVVEDAIKVDVHLPDGRVIEAEDILFDPRTDVGLVKIEPDNLPEAPLGNSEKLQVGDWVLAIGSPLGEALANSVSAGIVSAKGRRTGILRSKGGIEDFIQTDAAINRGNSGGPLVNIKGQVVGINSNILSATGMHAGLGFAVPTHIIKPVIRDLIKQGRPVRGFLGVSLTSLEAVEQRFPDKFNEKQLERGGAYIAEVSSDSAAEKAGLKPGDVILKVEDSIIESPEDLIREVGLRRPGEKVEMLIARNSEKITLNATLDERPESAQIAGRGPLGKLKKSQAYTKLGIIVQDYKGMVWGLLGMEQLTGARISFIKPGSIAEEYGLEVNDVITEANNRKIDSADDFENALSKANLANGLSLIVIDRRGRHKVVIKDSAF